MARPGTLVIQTTYALAFALLAACGSSHPAPAPATTTPTKPTPTATAHFLAGHWASNDGAVSETWTQLGDALVGVGFTRRGDKTSFEALLLHRDHGRMVYTAMPGGTRSIDFGADNIAATEASFANPKHDQPQHIRYRRKDDTLDIDLRGKDGKQQLQLRRRPLRPAPALEAADRAFAADSAQHGGSAWASRFTADGATWPRGSKRTAGPAAVGAAIDRLVAAGLTLLWSPVTSGLASDNLGFTIGRYHIVKAGKTIGRGAYLTVWQRRDGQWKIIFDTGVSTR